MKGESDVEKDQDKKNQPASKRKCKDQREVKTLRHCLATRSPASLIREDSWSWNIALDNQSVGLWTLCKVVVDFFEILHLATNLGCWDLPGEFTQYSQIKRLNYTYSCFFKLALFSSHLPLLLLLASVFISRLSPSPPFSSVTYVEGWLFLWFLPLFPPWTPCSISDAHSCRSIGTTFHLSRENEQFVDKPKNCAILISEGCSDLDFCLKITFWN